VGDGKRQRDPYIGGSLSDGFQRASVIWGSLPIATLSKSRHQMRQREKIYVMCFPRLPRAERLVEKGWNRWACSSLLWSPHKSSAPLITSVPHLNLLTFPARYWGWDITSLLGKQFVSI
jgi:hypothetical protein